MGTIGVKEQRKRSPTAVGSERRQDNQGDASFDHRVLRLQRAAGNAAVTAALSGRGSPPRPCTPGCTAVQRDLAAFLTERIQPTAVGSTHNSADAPGIRRALEPLIRAGKIVVTTSGNEDVFSSQGATAAKVSGLLAQAGYAKPADMASALVDPHNITTFTAQQKRKTKFRKTTRKDQLDRRQLRKLTASEASEARRVFHGVLKLDPIMLSEGGPMSIGGYARTVHNRVYFPDGSFQGDFQPFLIHELTHVWQYQQGVGLPWMIVEAVRAIYDYGGEPALRKAWDDGNAFDDFTTEQQGDILSDYYKRLRAGQDVSAYQGFVDQVRTGRIKERRYKTVEPLEAGKLDSGKLDREHRAKTEAAIVEQLKLRIRSGDRAAISARYQRVMQLFKNILPYWRDHYRERISARRSNDELVNLLFAKLSRHTRSEIFKLMGGLN